MSRVNIYQVGLELTKEEKAQLAKSLGEDTISFLALTHCPEVMPKGSCACWNLLFVVSSSLARRHRFTPVPRGQLNHAGDPNLKTDEFTLVIFVREASIRARGGMITQTLAWLDKARTAKVADGDGQWGYRQPSGRITAHPWGDARISREKRVAAKIGMVAVS